MARTTYLRAAVARFGARRRRTLASLALATLATGSLVAGIGVTSSASASQAKALAPYTIGLDSALSGSFAPYSVGTTQFFMSYIDYANAHGGVGGHPIKVISLDDKGDPGQTLLNFETLWGQDHVLAIDSSSQYQPSSYIQANQVPLFSSGPPTNMYSSHYTSVFSTGGQLPAWSAQTAYWVVRVLHRPVKKVAVIYSSAFDDGFVNFIHTYWAKLGATFIDMVPDQGPTANCSAYILKFKSEGIQYIDEQALEAPGCIIAESQLGWTPQYGQGGPVTSEIGEAELIGKPFVGVVAGSPNTLYTGLPIYSHPSAADRTFVGNIRKYYPSYANYDFLNGTGTIQQYGVADLLVTAMKGTLARYGRVTAPLLVKYTKTITNFNDGLQPIVPSFQPNCKTGGDATIWGFWHYNPNPTVTKPTLYMVPASGPNWITNTWLNLGKCYLTQLADKLFPNG